MTLLLNLYGGPGTGKSTTAAATFAELKFAGINAELATEYAKDLVWQESHKVLENQIYVFGKQYNRIHRLLEKVDVIITDSPLLLSLYYGQNALKEFKDLVWAVYFGLNNLDVFLERKKAYNPKGRLQTEEQAREVDVELKAILAQRNIKHITLPADREAPKVIANLIIDKLKVF